MLEIKNPIKLTLANIKSANLCDKLTKEDLTAIGEHVWDAYSSDVESRSDWTRRTSAAMDLALQIQKDKNFPWPGCSNIAFPLVTIASLQFHSRAYPAIIQGPDVVQCRVIGPDPDGKKTERAERVGDYMSWQLLEKDKTWEEDVDRSLITVPIVGTGWKKTYYNSDVGYTTSELVLAKDFVLNYWSKNVDTCPCKTQVLALSRNQMYSRCAAGIFQDIREESWYIEGAPQPTPTQESEESNTREGIRPTLPNDSTPFIGLEQHTYIDLDGDGYAEPVIVTIEESSHTVLRVVYRFDREEDIERNTKREVVKITSSEYFTKIPFIPNPDGGIMDIGFGVLLGPLNESVNSAINQLFDSGTISNTAGGFLGRGAKIRGGVYRFSPFEWNRVDSTGDDLRKSVIPLPVREPSNVMFSLLSLLIEYTERVSGAVDISTGGNPGQNTPAQTSQTMIEQGQKVFAAIFKRIWRSLKEEFRKMYVMNGIYLSDNPIYFAGSTNNISRADFLGDPSSITPVADPNILSDQQRFLQAHALMQVGNNNPLYDQDAINIKYLKGLKISNIEQVYKGTKAMGPPTPSEKVQIEILKAQVNMKELELKKLQFISSLLEQRKLNEAKIISLYAQASVFEKQAGGIEAAAQINEFRAKIDALKVINDTIEKQVASIGEMNNGNATGNTNGSGATEQAVGGSQATAVPGVEGAPGNGIGTEVGTAS